MLILGRNAVADPSLRGGGWMARTQNEAPLPRWPVRVEGDSETLIGEGGAVPHFGQASPGVDRVSSPRVISSMPSGRVSKSGALMPCSVSRPRPVEVNIHTVLINP